MTPMEKQLVQVWSQVLNMPAASLPFDQSFTSLGGDSISAMQVVSRSREHKMLVTVRDVLSCQSLPELALRSRFKAAGGTGSQALRAVDDKPFPLVPIQRHFFDHFPNGLDYYNQSFTVRLSKRVSVQDIEKAITVVMQQHPALRAHFTRNEDGQWTQHISSDVKSSFSFRHDNFNSLADALSDMDATQAGFDIQQGPLFGANVLELPDGQVLFLAAHHLVVDLVSWRIILEDLETLLSKGDISAAAVATERVTMPAWSKALPAWSKTLLQESTENPLNSVLPWTVPQADFAFWGMKGARNLIGDSATMEVRLDAASTKALLGPANTAFRTDPTDLMVAALAYSFREVFLERAIPNFFTESHGRNAWDDGIDLSRTVGWFTTIYPLVFQDAAAGLTNMVRQVKDMRRGIPSYGLPYFATRYLTEEGRAAFKDHKAMEILFNYVGQYQQLQQSDRLIQELTDTSVLSNDVPDTAPRLALMEIWCGVQGNELVLKLDYNTKMQHRERLQSWLDITKSTLQILSEALPAKPSTFTCCDFPMLSLGEESLQDLAEAVQNQVGFWGPDTIESAYPCSPMQQGILVSQSRDPRAYVVYSIFKVRAPENDMVRVDQLEQAWYRLIQYHPILRTIFVDSGRENGLFDQVVLRTDTTPVQKIFNYNGPDVVQQLQQCLPDTFSNSRPPIVPIICTTAQGDTYLCVQVNHALIDGTSFRILMHDLQSAYHDELNGSGPLYGDYMAYIHSKPVTESLAYWTELLSDARPCYFPNLSTTNERKLKKISHMVPNVARIRQLCRAHGVSIANFFQLAWSLVLRAFTGSDSVTFGYLTSGRDVPVDRIEEALGPLINMLVCNVNFEDSDQSAVNVLQQIRSKYIDSLPHQHCSLASIQHELGLGNKGLFNTVMSMQKVGEAVEDKTKVFFEEVDELDPSEVWTSDCHNTPDG